MLVETLTPQLYCSICDQVSFDNSIADIFPNGQIDKRDFYNYLSLTNASGQSVSYLQYLTGISNSNALAQSLQDDSKTFGSIDITKQYYIVMGEFSKIGVLSWIGIGIAGGAATAGIVVLAVVTGGASIPATITIIGGALSGGAAGYFIATTAKGSSGQDYLTPTIVGANSADFNALKCASIKTIG